MYRVPVDGCVLVEVRGTFAGVLDILIGYDIRMVVDEDSHARPFMRCLIVREYSNIHALEGFSYLPISNTR